MASYFKEGSKIQFEGYRGIVTSITETYRKNVLVVRITQHPPHRLNKRNSASIGLFEYPDGRLEFMNFID